MLQDARGRYPQEAPLRLRGLVLVPTRELAVQVGDVLRGLAHGLPHRTKIVVAVGGVSANPQMMALRGGADLLIATPGRLLDLLEQKALRAAAVQASAARSTRGVTATGPNCTSRATPAKPTAQPNRRRAVSRSSCAAAAPSTPNNGAVAFSTAE